MKTIWSALLVCALVFASVDADAARRIGSGGSVGKQSGSVSQQAAAPVPPARTQAAPAGPAQRASSPATAQAPAQSQAPRRGLGGLVGGLAAGLGLAWLANALGFGAELAQFMLFALLALVIMVVVGLLMRRRGTAAAVLSPYAFAGAGGPADRAAPPRQYSPDNVGNDASARPWEHNAFEAVPQGGAVQIGSALGPSNRAVPAGFDVAGFVDTARRNFITLQDAWDRCDLATLRSMMTDEMVAELGSELQQREQQRDGSPANTEIVMLDAQLLGIEDLGDAYMASVEYSGMIREEASAGPGPFREIWNMTKPKDGSAGWLVAGVQALQ